ncbi:hypothetical protein [Nostoc sp. DedQUE09]|uniref:hypothetical protein n=1 Tax=Nostoc sp. DedQUE09 TaxID=3075394 RepID=UPI002AD24102|nr:hypothetical protein [Nostoc sp. DedQUE09]MDZ7950399.1 hypothetical protein [Nostoc sp. DedQUE09]
MGLEPEMGRVGYETMIWLSEVDIYSLFNDFSQSRMLNHEQKMPFLEVVQAMRYDENKNN